MCSSSLVTGKATILCHHIRGKVTYRKPLDPRHADDIYGTFLYYLMYVNKLVFSTLGPKLPISSKLVQVPSAYAGVIISRSFKNTKNLFIHIALIPEGDNPRVNPNILKCLLHSPVAKGYRLVVIASRAMVCKTPTYYLILNSLAFARGCVILRSHILFPLLLILLISHHI